MHRWTSIRRAGAAALMGAALRNSAAHLNKHTPTQRDGSATSSSTRSNQNNRAERGMRSSYNNNNNNNNSGSGGGGSRNQQSVGDRTRNRPNQSSNSNSSSQSDNSSSRTQRQMTGTVRGQNHTRSSESTRSRNVIGGRGRDAQRSGSDGNSTGTPAAGSVVSRSDPVVVPGCLAVPSFHAIPFAKEKVGSMKTRNTDDFYKHHTLIVDKMLDLSEEIDRQLMTAHRRLVTIQTVTLSSSSSGISESKGAERNASSRSMAQLLAALDDLQHRVVSLTNKQGYVSCNGLTQNLFSLEARLSVLHSLQSAVHTTTATTTLTMNEGMESTSTGSDVTPFILFASAIETLRVRIVEERAFPLEFGHLVELNALLLHGILTQCSAAWVSWGCCVNLSRADVQPSSATVRPLNATLVPSYAARVAREILEPCVACLVELGMLLPPSQSSRSDALKEFLLDYPLPQRFANHATVTLDVKESKRAAGETELDVLPTVYKILTADINAGVGSSSTAPPSSSSSSSFNAACVEPRFLIRSQLLLSVAQLAAMVNHGPILALVQWNFLETFVESEWSREGASHENDAWPMWIRKEWKACGSVANAPQDSRVVRHSAAYANHFAAKLVATVQYGMHTCELKEAPALAYRTILSSRESREYSQEGFSSEEDVDTVEALRIAQAVVNSHSSQAPSLPSQQANDGETTVTIVSAAAKEALAYTEYRQLHRCFVANAQLPDTHGNQKEEEEGTHFPSPFEFQIMRSTENLFAGIARVVGDSLKSEKEDGEAEGMEDPRVPQVSECLSAFLKEYRAILSDAMTSASQDADDDDGAINAVVSMAAESVLSVAVVATRAFCAGRRSERAEAEEDSDDQDERSFPSIAAERESLRAVQLELLSCVQKLMEATTSAASSGSSGYAMPLAAVGTLLQVLQLAAAESSSFPGFDSTLLQLVRGHLIAQPAQPCDVYSVALDILVSLSAWEAVEEVLAHLERNAHVGISATVLSAQVYAAAFAAARDAGRARICLFLRARREQLFF